MELMTHSKFYFAEYGSFFLAKFYFPFQSLYNVLKNRLVVMLLTFKHLDSFWFCVQMIELLGLSNCVSGFDSFQSLLMAFLLYLSPLFVEQFTCLGLSSVHFN